MKYGNISWIGHLDFENESKTFFGVNELSSWVAIMLMSEEENLMVVEEMPEFGTTRVSIITSFQSKPFKYSKFLVKSQLSFIKFREWLVCIVVNGDGSQLNL